MSQSRVHAILSGAAAQAVVDCVIQNRLTVAALIHQQVSGKHILPCPVEEGYLPPAVGAGQLDIPYLLQIGCHLFFCYSSIQQALLDLLPYQFLQMAPVYGRQIKAHAGVAAGAVDQQQAASSMESDAVGIPAGASFGRGSLFRFAPEQPLERPGQSKLHTASSLRTNT